MVDIREREREMRHTSVFGRVCQSVYQFVNQNNETAYVKLKYMNYFTPDTPNISTT